MTVGRATVAVLSVTVVANFAIVDDKVSALANNCARGTRSADEAEFGLTIGRATISGNCVSVVAGLEASHETIAANRGTSNARNGALETRLELASTRATVAGSGVTIFAVFSGIDLKITAQLGDFNAEFALFRASVSRSKEALGGTTVTISSVAVIAHFRTASLSITTGWLTQNSGDGTSETVFDLTRSIATVAVDHVKIVALLDRGGKVTITAKTNTDARFAGSRTLESYGNST